MRNQTRLENYALEVEGKRPVSEAESYANVELDLELLEGYDWKICDMKWDLGVGGDCMDCIYYRYCMQGDYEQQSFSDGSLSQVEALMQFTAEGAHCYDNCYDQKWSGYGDNCAYDLYKCLTNSTAIASQSGMEECLYEMDSSGSDCFDDYLEFCDFVIVPYHAAIYPQQLVPGATRMSTGGGSYDDDMSCPADPSDCATIGLNCSLDCYQCGDCLDDPNGCPNVSGCECTRCILGQQTTNCPAGCESRCDVCYGKSCPYSCY